MYMVYHSWEEYSSEQVMEDSDFRFQVEGFEWYLNYFHWIDYEVIDASGLLDVFEANGFV